MAAMSDPDHMSPEDKEVMKKMFADFDETLLDKCSDS